MGAGVCVRLRLGLGLVLVLADDNFLPPPSFIACIAVPAITGAVVFFDSAVAVGPV